MNVIEYDRYGGPEVLTVREHPIPQPGRGQVLVRVAGAALNPKDILVRAGKFKLLSGRRFPRRFGFDWSGEVVSVGPGVREVAVGARLFGMLNGWQGGAMAEYLVADVDECADAPEGVDLVEASALPLAALTAYQALCDLGHLTAGQRVLVNGAAGGVGTFAVQIARALGAEVEGTASAANTALVLELGAQAVHDYRTLDLAGMPGRFDVVFDAFGNLPFARVRPALSARGCQITTVFNARTAREQLATLLQKQRLKLVYVRSRRADLTRITELVHVRKLKPVIDRVVPLAELDAAQRHLATRHARGKIVIRIG